ncbi:MAG: glycosyltransferase family 4 protein, partial [Mycobacterium sp.]
MRIGMVCPYSFDVPGGVQSHVLQLAEVMRARGQNVSVLAPSSPHVSLPDYVVSAGKAVPIPYNGSVARLQFSPAVHGRVRRWLADGDFDVLHLHEPNAPSLSMWALRVAEGPIVATFHASTTKSLTLSVFQGVLRPWHEKIVGRIAVSDLARRWQMEALGSDAVEIPNGVDVASFASAPGLDGYPRPGKTVLFLGRYDEPRKGMAVLMDALPSLVDRFPGVQLLIVGRGDEDELRSNAGELAGHLRFLGQVDDVAKASALRSA